MKPEEMSHPPMDQLLEMEEINGATSTTLASAPSHDKALSMVVDADTARVAVPVQTLESFWTSCDKCGFQFEYEFKYLGHLRLFTMGVSWGVSWH
jgi:hypothetical protein